MNRRIEEGGICIHPLGNSFMRTGQQKHSVTLLPHCISLWYLVEKVMSCVNNYGIVIFSLDDRVKLLVILGQ